MANQEMTSKLIQLNAEEIAVVVALITAGMATCSPTSNESTICSTDALGEGAHCNMGCLERNGGSLRHENHVKRCST